MKKFLCLFLSILFSTLISSKNPTTYALAMIGVGCGGMIISAVIKEKFGLDDYVRVSDPENKYYTDQSIEENPAKDIRDVIHDAGNEKNKRIKNQVQANNTLAYCSLSLFWCGFGWFVFEYTRKG